MCHFANYSAQPFLDIGHIEARSVFACTQRKDAATVSYTEIVVGSGTVLMKYHHGPLCNGSTDFVERIISLHKETMDCTRPQSGRKLGVGH